MLVLRVVIVILFFSVFLLCFLVYVFGFTWGFDGCFNRAAVFCGLKRLYWFISLPSSSSSQFLV